MEHDVELDIILDADVVLDELAVARNDATTPDPADLFLEVVEGHYLPPPDDPYAGTYGNGSFSYEYSGPGPVSLNVELYA